MPLSPCSLIFFLLLLLSPGYRVSFALAGTPASQNSALIPETLVVILSILLYCFTLLVTDARVVVSG